jgi:predicted MPP superfamily phosphohydrolase
MPSRFKQFRRAAGQTLRKVKARLRHAALTTMPLWLSRGKLRTTRSVMRVHLVERSVALANLPDALDGLRIAHLTDLHIGSLVGPDRLPAIVEATNGLRGDLIAVTGDFVDLSLKVLDQVIAAMAQLHAPLGVYFVPGNHDYLDNGGRLIARFREAGLRMLINEAVTLTHHDRRIVVSGVDFPHQPRDMRTFVQQAMRSAPRRKDDGLRILLSHHPDAFDAAVKHRIDLTLAGHTHGGQVVLSNGRGKKGSLGLGSLAHRYPRGLYQRSGCYLYVNSGVGSWFPLRVNCPAEIACLTLRNEPVVDAPVM